jgi:hypothetical protein
MSTSSTIADGTSLVHAVVAAMSAGDIPMLQGIFAPGAELTVPPRTLGWSAKLAHDSLGMRAKLKEIVPDILVSSSRSCEDCGG